MLAISFACRSLISAIGATRLPLLIKLFEIIEAQMRFVSDHCALLTGHWSPMASQLFDTKPLCLAMALPVCIVLSQKTDRSLETR